MDLILSTGAGFFFGLWPLFLNKGESSSISLTMLMEIGVAAIVTQVAILNMWIPSRVVLYAAVAVCVYLEIQILVRIAQAESVNGWVVSMNVNWRMLICATLCAATGLMLFNSMSVTANATRMTMLFIVMVMVQITVPAVYKIYLESWRISPAQVWGFVAAFTAAYLLQK